VLSSRVRVASLIGFLALLALGVSVSSAGAAITASRITSPADPTFAYFDETKDLPTTVLYTVEGTVTGAASGVDVRCYFGDSATEYHVLAEAVTVTAGRFSLPVTAKMVSHQPCVLRAVPEGYTGAPSAFTGPSVTSSYFEIYSNSATSTAFSYELSTFTLGAEFEIESAGECGLDYSRLFVPGSLEPNAHLFECNSGLLLSDETATGTHTRSALQVDGANAYSPGAAHYVEAEETHAPIKNAPQIAVTQSFDPATALATIHEIDPIVKCAPETVYPVTSTSCTHFVSTGVELERSWQTTNADQVASMTDTWRSTDAAPHTVNALYTQYFADHSPAPGGAYKFPGAGAFSPTTKGSTIALPGGPNTILYKENAGTPDVGDGEFPQGAIVYDSSPSEPLAIFSGSDETNDYNGFEMPYQRTIPAGGSSTLRMAFVQGYGLSEVESLAKAVLASYPPTVSISSPTNGTSVASPGLTVSGTASDTGALASLVVNGQAVSVGAGGAWSSNLTLSPGTNTITAVATDQAGLSSSSSVSVVYTPPIPPVIPIAHASQVGSASGANGAVSFTVACTGAAGTSCDLESLLSAVEKTKGGKPVAVVAKAKGKTKSKHITVGSAKLVIPAGQRVKVTIAPNALGRSLLARFHKLPVHLEAVLVTGGVKSTVIAENLTIVPKKSKHKKKRHG
jgi:hypothetical protein